MNSDNPTSGASKNAAAFYRKAVPVSPPPRIRNVVVVGADELFLGDAGGLSLLGGRDGALVVGGEQTNNNNNNSTTNAATSTSTTSTTTTRHLTLFDLVAVGLGGTLGSGLFVLSGLVAHRYAGPAAVGSWAAAGAAAGLSGACYAELSGRVPAAGSAYAYAYVAMGELPALLAAACLSLEYCVASSAVARSWGDKVVVYLKEEMGAAADGGDDGSRSSHWLWRILLSGDHESCFNPFALVISTGTVVLLLHGVHESKRATTLFTGLKVALVVFMIVAGFWHTQPSHWKPFNPLGVRGVFRGSVSTFFGFLGYDQVVGLAGEALEPKRNLPRAILLTLAAVTAVYCLATLALTGMQPYAEISPVSGFPLAFESVQDHWAGQLTAVGEIVTLPIVLLVTVQVQPRLLHAMAEDGLVAAWFGRADPNGNLWNGTCFAGAILILFSAAVPFSYLNDTISCAVLAALNLSNTSLVLMWHEDPIHPEITDCRNRAEWIMLAFHVAAIAASVTLTRFGDTLVGKATALLAVSGMIASAIAVAVFCPRTERFGGNHRHPHSEAVKSDPRAGYFRTPFVPYWPCLGIFVNWYLIAQLDFLGVAGLLVFWCMVVVYYFVVAVHHSIGGKQAAAAAASVTSSSSENGIDGVINETTPLSQAQTR